MAGDLLPLAFADTSMSGDQDFEAKKASETVQAIRRLQLRSDIFEAEQTTQDATVSALDTRVATLEASSSSAFVGGAYSGQSAFGAVSHQSFNVLPLSDTASISNGSMATPDSGYHIGFPSLGRYRISAYGHIRADISSTVSSTYRISFQTELEANGGISFFSRSYGSGTAHSYTELHVPFTSGGSETAIQQVVIDTIINVTDLSVSPSMRLKVGVGVESLALSITGLAASYMASVNFLGT